MSDVVGSTQVPMEGIEDLSKKRVREGGDLAGREVKEVSSPALSDQQIEAAFTEIEQLLEKARSSSDLSKKEHVLFQTHSHLGVLKKALQGAGSEPTEKLRKEEYPVSFEARLKNMVGQVHDLDKAVKAEMSQERLVIRQRLKSACDEVLAADNPISVLKTALGTAESFYGVDARYRPFLKDVRLLLSAFETSPQEAKRLLVPFFQKVLVDDPHAGGIFALEAHEIAAELLFLMDCGQVESFPTSLGQEERSELKEKVSDLLREQKTHAEEKISEYQQSPCYDSEDVRSTLFPQAVSAAIVRKDGTLNLGLIPLVKSIFLPPKAERQAMERHIATSLRELESDESVVMALESFPILTQPEAIEDVNCLLQRSLDTPLSQGDTLHAVLTTFFTWWRQGRLGNCYLVSTQEFRRESLGLWMIQDIQELLTHQRTLTRTIDGEPVTSVGLPWAHKEAVAKKMPVESIPFLFHLKAVTQACELLGCTGIEEFTRVAKEIASKNPDSTFYLLEVFEVFCQNHSIPPDRLVQAIRVIEAQSKNLLLRVWENAMGGFLFPPLSSSHMPTHFYQQRYFAALVQSALNYAKQLGLTEIVARLEQVARMCESTVVVLTELPRNSVPPSWSLLRPSLIPESPVVADSSGMSFALMHKDPASGQLMPFGSSEEVGVFLQRSFEQWVTSLAESGETSDSLEMAHIEPSIAMLTNFEEALQQKVPSRYSTDFQVSGMLGKGVFNGVLCYSIRGTEEFFNFLEQGSIQVSGGEKKDFGDTVAEAIPNFLRWMDGFRQQHGKDPSLTVSVVAPYHVFRLIPNHPSLLPWHEKVDDVKGTIQDRSDRILSRRISRDSCYKKTEKVIDFMGYLVFARNRPTDVTEKDVYDKITEETRKQLKGKTRPTIQEFCSAVIAAVEEVNRLYDPENKHLSPSDLASLKYSLLAKLDRVYVSLPIHFADTNWTTAFSGKNEALHFAMWFDPFTKEWDVITIPESGQMFSDDPEKMFSASHGPRRQDFFKMIYLQTISQPVKRRITEKLFLQVERARSKKLLQLEKSFATAWGIVEDKIRELSPQRRQRIFEIVSTFEPTEEGGMSPIEVVKRLTSSQFSETVIEAGRRCTQIRDAYQQLLTEPCRHVEPQPVVVHTMNLAPYSPATQHLTEDDDSFLEAFTDLVRPLAVAF